VLPLDAVIAHCPLEFQDNGDIILPMALI
jgi:hypothetical protein